jgi:hypothetical protein
MRGSPPRSGRSPLPWPSSSRPSRSCVLGASKLAHKGRRERRRGRIEYAECDEPCGASAGDGASRGGCPSSPHEYLELAAAGSRLKYRWSTVPTSRQIYFWLTDLIRPFLQVPTRPANTANRRGRREPTSETSVIASAGSTSSAGARTAVSLVPSASRRSTRSTPGWPGWRTSLLGKARSARTPRRAEES